MKLSRAWVAVSCRLVRAPAFACVWPYGVAGPHFASDITPAMGSICIIIAIIIVSIFIITITSFTTTIIVVIVIISASVSAQAARAGVAKCRS